MKYLDKKNEAHDKLIGAMWSNLCIQVRRWFDWEKFNQKVREHERKRLIHQHYPDSYIDWSNGVVHLLDEFGNEKMSIPIDTTQYKNRRGEF